MAGHRRRGSRPGGGADRLREDPGGLPARPRFPAATQRPSPGHEGGLRLPAEGARGGCGTQPARPAGRNPRGGRAAGPQGFRGHRRRALGRHPGPRPRPDAAQATGCVDHHTRVAVSDAHVLGPGIPPRRRDGDNRRDPRRRRFQTRHPPGPQPGAPGPAGRARRAACGPVRHRASRRKGGGLPRGRPGRGRGGSRDREKLGRPGRHSPAERSLAPRGEGDPGFDPEGPVHAGVRELPPGGGEADGSPQRAVAGCRRRRGPGSRPPRFGQQTSPGRDRGRAQGGAAAGRRGHELLGAGHRHGRRRPGDPDQRPLVHFECAAAFRPGRAPGGCDLPGTPPHPAPRGAGGRGRDRIRHDRGPDRGAAHPCAGARRPGPADRSRCRRRGGCGTGDRDLAGGGSAFPSLLRPEGRRLRRGPAVAARHLSQRRFLGAAGPPGAARRPVVRPARGRAARRHIGRHHPGPGSLRGVPGRR